MRETLRKVLSLVLAVSMVMSMSTAAVLAADGEEEPTCGLTQHTHTEACYEERETLTCTLTEGEGHTHDDSCYGKELTCSETESDGHAHGDGCYTVEEVLACDEDHDHTGDCYTQEETLTCTETESEGHTHDDSCYGKELTCSETESDGHTHGDGCYTVEKVLTCKLEEHTHSEECRKAPELPLLPGSSGAQTVPEVVEAPGLLPGEQPGAVEPQPVCNCTTRCSEHSVSGDCPVCFGRDGAQGDVSLCAAPAPLSTGEMEVLSVTARDDNGDERDVTGGEGLELRGGNSAAPLQLTFDVACPGTDKTVELTLPRGVGLVDYAKPNMTGYEENLLSASHSGNDLEGIKIRFTFQPDCVRSVFYVTIGIDTRFWNGLDGEEFLEPLEMTAGDGTALYTAEVRTKGDSGNYTFYGSSGNSALGRKGSSFRWVICSWRKSTWLGDFVLDVDMPYDEETKFCPTLDEEKLASLKADGYQFEVDEENHKIHITAQDVYSRTIELYFTCQEDLPEGYSSLTLKGGYHIEMQTLVNRQVKEDGDWFSTTLKTGENVWMYGNGTSPVTNYNWHNEKPDLLYPTKGINLNNYGVEGLYDKKFVYTFENTDKAGVRAVNIPITPKSIRYRTVNDPENNWQTVPEEKLQNLGGGGKFLFAPEGDYFLEVEVVTEPAPPSWKNYVADGRVSYFQFRQDREDLGEKEFSLGTVELYSCQDGAWIKGNGETAHLYVLPTNNPDDSCPGIGGGYWDLYGTGAGSAKGVTAGERATVKVYCGAAYGSTSGYIYDPVFYIRLPEYLSLDTETVKLENLTGPGMYTVTQGERDEEGFIVYTVKLTDAGRQALQGTGAFVKGNDEAEYQNSGNTWVEKSVNGIHLAAQVIADESAPDVVLDTSSIFFMDNGNGGSYHRSVEQVFELSGGRTNADANAFVSDKFTVRAISKPVTFEGRAEDSDSCTFVPDADGRGGTAYVSEDGEVNFTFTLQNPAGAVVKDTVLKNFYYDIPVFSAPAGAAYELELKDVTLDEADADVELKFLYSADGGKTWSDKKTSKTNMVRVQVEKGQSLNRLESASFHMSYTVTGLDGANWGDNSGITAEGVLVSPNSDNQKGNPLSLKLVVATGKLSGRVYVDRNGNGAYDEGDEAQAGVTVTAAGTDADESNVFSVRTDDEGRYAFTGLRKGGDNAYELSLSNPDVQNLLFTKDSVFVSGDNRTAAVTKVATVEGVSGIDAVLAKRTCTISYDLQGGVGDEGCSYEPNTVSYGAKVTVNPEPTKEGYAFTGWYVEGETAPQSGQEVTMTHDLTLVAQWTPKLTPVVPTVSVYQVEHYLEQLDGTYRLEKATTLILAEIGSTVTAQEETFERYTLDETVEGTVSSGEVFQTKAGADGKPEYLVLKLYYKLDTVTLTVKYVDESGKDLHDSKTVEGLKYGSRQTEEAVTISGYQLVGEETQTAVMEGDQELTFVYKVKPADRPSTPDPDPDDDDDDTPDPKPDPDPDPDPKPAPDPKGEPEEDLDEDPVPLAQPEDMEESLEEDLEKVSVPLAQPEDVMEEDLDEEPVPLADVPKTGDDLLLWLVLSAASAAGLVWLTLSGRKREED